MPNKRIRKKWLSRLTKDARRIAKRFKISRQEVGFVLSGTVVESTLQYKSGTILSVVQDCTFNPTVSYDVLLFGAVGDGVTDDTRTIQSAVDFAFGKSPIEPLQEYMQKYPTWFQIVDGSVIEPITDRGRLLEGKRT